MFTSFVLIIVSLCTVSFTSAQQQLRGLSDPRTVEVKDCQINADVPFLSQYREDEAVFETFFKNTPKCGGTVVEMGGFDGKRFSNSWFFQYALGWRALLVEAFPENFQKMITNRPDAINVFGAMCLGKSISFQTGKNLAAGGAIDDMSENHKKMWTDANTGLVEVPCMLVTDVLLTNGIDHVDLFYLDVEGAELTVLQTIDWGKVQINMFVVEMDNSNVKKDEAVRAVLQAHGYITPFSLLEYCSKKQEECMPSELFILEDVWNEVKSSVAV